MVDESFRHEMLRYKDIIPDHIHEPLEAGGVVFDPADFSFVVRGDRIWLTPIKCALLVKLMQESPCTLTNKALYEYVWVHGYDSSGDDLVKNHIMAIRKSIEQDPSNPEIVLTNRYYGYYIPRN